MPVEEVGDFTDVGLKGRQVTVTTIRHYQCFSIGLGGRQFVEAADRDYLVGRAVNEHQRCTDQCDAISGRGGLCLISLLDQTVGVGPKRPPGFWIRKGLEESVGVPPWVKNALADRLKLLLRHPERQLSLAGDRLDETGDLAIEIGGGDHSAHQPGTKGLVGSKWPTTDHHIPTKGPSE